MNKFFLASFLLLSALSISHSQTRSEGVFGPDRLKYVLGQDGATSIPLTFKNGEKRFLWTFGDTILGGWKGPVATTATLNFSDIADMKAMPCNTLALSPVPDDKNHKNLFFKFYPGTGAPKEFIAYEKAEDPFLKRMWADDGAQEGGKVYVFYMDIKMKKKAGDFDFLGTGLAVSETPKRPDVSGFAFRRSEKFYAEKLLLGDSVVRKSGYFYILGRLSLKNDGNLNALFLSRVKPAKIEDFSAYEFLSSDGKWQKEKKTSFFDDVAGEASLAWDEYRKVFRIIYMSAKTQEIKSAVFSDFGKFAGKPETAVLHKPEPKKDAMYYSAKEIFHTKKAVYLIYIDPSIYQPILVISGK